MLAEPVVLVFDLDLQFGTQQLPAGVEPDPTCVSQQLRVKKKRRSVSLNAMVRGEVLA